jgi:hypothetical protein
MNAIRYLSLGAAVILMWVTACNYTVGECWPVGQGGASSEGVTAGGGGIIIPTGPSGAGGFGDQPPKQPLDAPDPKQEIKCNSDGDEEDAEEGSPESTSGNGPSAPQIGSYSPSIFKFITTIPDDGTDEAGGWQEAKVSLFVKRTYALTVESFTCPQITIGTPLRNSSQGKISPERAAEASAEIATYVSGVIKDVPQGIFCIKLKEGMAKMIKQAIHGATVKQP